MVVKKRNCISVIIPVFNVEKYLEECVKSVLNQTHTDLEIILVDDGSTDNSGEICDRFKEIDDRIQVIHMHNEGVSAARNKGLAVAHGDYIGFVDSDDVIEPQMYEILLGLLLEYEVPLACARFDIIGETDNKWILPSDTGNIRVLSSHDMLKIMIWPWAEKNGYASFSVWDRLYRKDIIKNMIFPEGFHYGEDMTYSTEAILASEQCVFIDKSIYHYRVLKGSITHDKERMKDLWLYNKLPQERKVINRLIQNGYNDLGTMLKFNSDLDLYRLKSMCTDIEDKDYIMQCIRELNLSNREIICNIPGWKDKLKTIIKKAFFSQYAKKSI